MTEEIKIILDTDKLPNFADTFIDINTYKRLEQENKVLRKTKSKLLADLHETNDVCNAWEKEVNNLRSALEEIKEKIKSLNKDICNNCGWYNTDNCQPNGYVCHDLIEIKNKIKEVLNVKY